MKPTRMQHVKPKKATIKATIQQLAEINVRSLNPGQLVSVDKVCGQTCYVHPVSGQFKNQTFILARDMLQFDYQPTLELEITPSFYDVNKQFT